MVRSDLTLSTAIQAAHFDGERLGFDPRALGDGPFRQHIKIDLDAVGHDPAKRSDAQPDDADF